MTLMEEWRNKTKQILMSTYKDKMPEKNIDLLLDTLLLKAQENKRNIMLRNLYTHTNFSVDLNDFAAIIQREKLCLGANGTLTYDYTVSPSPVAEELIKEMKERKLVKKQAIKAEAEGDFLSAKYYDNLQNYIKINMNSFYGIQLQKGSFLYNPDTATMITTQARELTSEMMWAIERFVSSNFQFATFNEMFMYLNTLKNKETTGLYTDYIEYIPTNKDLIKRLTRMFQTIPDYVSKASGFSKSLYLFVLNLTTEEKIKIYYSSNLLEFIRRNPKVFTLIESILINDEKFMSPERIPDVYKDTLDLLVKVLEEYVMLKITTTNRVEKYLNGKRKAIIISDTDSIMINLGPWVDFCAGLSKKKFDKFDDDETTIKIVNIMTYMCTYITQVASKAYCTQCNVPQELHSYISFKNEFLFKRLVLYKGIKKNYAAHTVLREGTKIDKIAMTGIKLNSSGKNIFVKEYIENIITNKILKKKQVNPLEILNDIKMLENIIIGKLREGNMSFGRSERYSGLSNYVDIYLSAPGRGAMIWNSIYPEDPVNEGEYAYIFSTSLTSPESCLKIKDINPEMYERIRERILEDKKLSRYCLSKICIPKSGNIIKSIPDWLIPFIDVQDIVNKHLEPISSLLPSLGVYKSRISSNEHQYSSLISF